MHRPRPRTLTLGALALLLAAAPFVPHGADDEGAIVPSGDGKYGALGGSELGTSATAGSSRLTPEMQAEIDRVVDAGRALGPELRDHFGFGLRGLTARWRTLLSHLPA